MEWLGKPEMRKAQPDWSGGWEDVPFFDGDGMVHRRTYSDNYSTAAPGKPALKTGGSGRAAVSSAPMLQLQAGDSVSHNAFGTGMVLSIRPMGGDALIEVAFDQVGTKKLMLKAASQHLKIL